MVNTTYSNFTTGIQVLNPSDIDGTPYFIADSTGVTINGTALATAELGYLDGITPGTATASKALVLDSSKGIATITTATITTATVPTAITTTIQGTADVNTTIVFGDDSIVGTAGGVEFVRIVEDTQDVITFNNGAVDVDFTVKKLTSGNAFAYDAGADSVALNGATVGVTGAATITGALTQTTGAIILNNGATDNDFTAKKLTSGNWLAYDAGTDALLVNGATVGITGATTVTGALTATGVITRGVTNAITAFAGGGQGSATALTADINSITTCATAADSVKLPAATAGRMVQVSNLGAAYANVFPATGELIDALAANAAISLAVGGSIIFTCAVAGSWKATVQVRPGAKYTTGTTTTTFAAGQLTGSLFVVYNNTQGSPGSIATRTAAEMFADDPYARVGGTYHLRVINNQGTGTLTITAGSNVTLTGTMTVAVNTFRDFVVTYTTAAALVIQQCGVGTDA